ncbi:MAG: patatin family protein [Lachnospiraceae bacterium]|nr:patatin family protein [Lachnospiraceae bacterium]
MGREVYEKIAMIPWGKGTDTVTPGCMVLEGGGWRGLYTLGVLDVLMIAGVNLEATVGISAGALCGLGYTTGQIGWGAKIDLTFRHDDNFCGINAIKKEHAITGFEYLYKEILKEYPLDKKRLKETPKRLAVGCTNIVTGEIEYFEKGNCNLSKAVSASASVPYVSRPVIMNKMPYLDGGCATKIPYEWAEREGYKKVVVVKTREHDYRRAEDSTYRMAHAMYHKFPEFVKAIEGANKKFNETVDLLYALEASGEVFIIEPSEVVTVTRFEGNMEKLGNLYWMGYNDGNNSLPRLKEYLGIKD